MGRIINIDDSGIHHVIYTEKMSRDDLEAFKRETQEVLDSNPKDILALVDVSAYILDKKRDKDYPYNSLQVIRDISKKIRPYIKKEAVIVKNTIQRMFTQAIHSITGRNANTGFFKTKEDALKWLKE